MKILNVLIICLTFSFLSTSCAITLRFGPKKYKVGLLIMATGKYTCFVEPLIKSAEKYFLPNHNITYFVFTDGQIIEANNIIKVYQKRLGWPFDTMMRFSVYYNAKELLEQMDYLFACDADMLFVNTVGDEILGERVATRHPGFITDRHDDYETDPISTAYIKSGEGEYYFAGGFYGGTSSEFLKMAKTCTDNIAKDLSINYIAKWHDESHLNRYFIDNKPTNILCPSYCYPESWNLPFPKKLLALDKNHAEFQTKKNDLTWCDSVWDI